MTFLEKYAILKKSIPVPAVRMGPNTVDCEYSDQIYIGKNNYNCFDGFYLEDSIYVKMGAWGKNLVDCSNVSELEKCYECIDCFKCYGSTYLLDCHGSTDCYFSAFLNSCTDCFGCVALTHKKYCIFNKQYTKEEYFRKVEVLKKEKPENILDKMFELKKQLPHPASQQADNENCPYGNYIYNSKNCYWCFNTYYNQNCGYTFDSSRENNCWDTFSAGGKPEGNTLSERCYEIVHTETCYNCAFLIYCDNCVNCYYSERLTNCSDCFGCVGLKNKKYCVLNNQLTKEQYAQALKEIKKELGWK